ncbi:MAG: ATP-dependent nuclease [Sphingomicrobium sp.]
MAAVAKPKDEPADLVTFGKVRRLTVSNFRAIGTKPVVVDLDNIVVLVGPNNAGKSSILRAYEVAMSEGSNAGKLTIEDFPNGKIDPENLPTIELETEVQGPAAEKWLVNMDGVKVVRERWVFSKEGKGDRHGWNNDKGEWDTKKPWGFAAVANKQRPQPHAVKAFDPPEKQAAEITKIVTSLIDQRAKNIPAADGEGTEFEQLSQRLAEFQNKVIHQSQADVAEIEEKLTELLAGIFAEHVVQFAPELAPFDKVPLFSGSQMRVGPVAGYKSTLELQGSGARRCILWAALKVASERDDKNEGRPHLLLIDEPELCLHPRAVHEAANVLYDLAERAGWQVMVTTHHPGFIDLSRNNETIVRVERGHAGSVEGTTLFRPATAKLSEDDRVHLKLLNIFDPYVAEFFFGGHVVLVEGDTEYSALKLVAAALLQEEGQDQIPEPLLRSLVVVRARGKAPLISLAKILNHFGARYSILHDSDAETIEVKDKSTGGTKSQVNPAWTLNGRIWDEVSASPNPDLVRVIASVPNFEEAYLGYEATREKPYAAVEALRNESAKRETIAALLHALLDHKQSLPAGAEQTSELLKGK